MRISNYAKALYGLAMEHKKIDLLTYQFDDFKNSMESNHTWVRVMDSPMMTLDEKKIKIDALAYDGLFLSFLKMLAQKNMMHLYLEIYEEWINLSRAFQKIAHIHIYTAKQMTQQHEDTLKSVLQPRFPNQKLDFHITVDENLLGGVKIVYQGQSLDRSIARELEELYTTI